MAENEQVTATPEPEQAAPTSTATEKTGGKVFTEAEVEQMLKERLDREKSKREKAAAEAAAKAADEAAAKNGEWEKVAKANEAKLAEMAAQLKARELADRRRAAAEKAGLPASLAARLTGETDEELEKDAKALSDLIKPQPKQPGLQPANPGANGSTQETDAQKRARLFGERQDMFSKEFVEKHGGGIFTVDGG